MPESKEEQFESVMQETSFLNQHQTSGLRTLECIHANPSQLVDIRMINFREESDFRSNHGIFLWKEQFKLEYSTYINNHISMGIPSYGDDSGPLMLTAKYRRLSFAGAPEIPGGGSAINRSVSLRIRRGSAVPILERGLDTEKTKTAEVSLK
jgi:hypothetical protein